MFEPASHDRVAVQFRGPESGTGPLTWAQKAILQDMEASGGQFTMNGGLDLPAGSTIDDAAQVLSGAMGRHAALRMRLATDTAGNLCQEISGSGQTSLEILTLPDDADPAYAKRYAAELMDTWPLARFDFRRDWPLRMAVIRLRGACLYMVWALSHLAADGGANMLLLADLLAGETTHRAAAEHGPTPLDLARSEQTPQLRQLSDRAMRYWESQLRHIPAQTFGAPACPPGHQGARYSRVRFRSPAAHLAMLTIARRTRTDVSRVTLAVIATAIGRVFGVHPLTVKIAVNNRFRPGLADYFGPISQNSVLTIDVTDATIDEVVARARGAALTAGMRAYYDPDALSEVISRLDAERGYPARVTCRVNDQRAMVMRTETDADPAEVTLEQVRQKLAETSLTWLGPVEHLIEQAFIVVENRPADVVSLHLLWDRWSFTSEQVEAFLRGVEDVAVEAAFNAAAPTKVLPVAQAQAPG
jgi:Condensation domain